LNSFFFVSGAVIQRYDHGKVDQIESVVFSIGGRW
jgi:hypothetical protein